jgi:hypothetical protein
VSAPQQVSPPSIRDDPRAAVRSPTAPDSSVLARPPVHHRDPPSRKRTSSPATRHECRARCAGTAVAVPAGMLVARLFVPLIIPQRPAAAVAPASGPSLIIGGGFSLAVHLALIALFATSSPALDVEAALVGEATAVPIMVSALAVDEDVPAAEAAPVSAARPAVVSRPPRRRSSPQSHSLVAVAAAHPAPAPVIAAAGVDPTSLPSPVVQTTSAAGPPRPLQVSPEVGRGLRLQDDYPQLPEALRISGFEHTVLLEVCVSVRGAVDEIRFASHTTGELRRDLEQAIRGWRYRPLLKDGGPVPYCHQMRIQYRMT